LLFGSGSQAISYRRVALVIGQQFQETWLEDVPGNIKKASDTSDL